MFNYNYNILRLCGTEISENNLEREAYELCELLQCNSNGKKIFDQIAPLIDRHEYCAGGKTVRRGYYCSNIYETFTVGGKNRGRLLKKIPNNSKVSYEYGFINDCLTIVKNYCNFRKASLYNIEFIERLDDMEVGIAFDVLDGKIADVSSVYVCQYDNGRLINDRLLLINGTNIGDNENDYIYEKNLYEYDGTILSRAIHLEYIPNIELSSKEYITFICDEYGCPVKFIINNNLEFVNNITKVNQEYYKKEHMNYEQYDT